MNETKNELKDRQLHIENYQQIVPAEQEEYAEVSAHSRIAENNVIITDVAGTVVAISWFKLHLTTRNSVNLDIQHSRRIICKYVKTKEPPYTERYVRWCERSGKFI